MIITVHSAALLSLSQSDEPCHITMGNKSMTREGKKAYLRLRLPLWHRPEMA